MPGEYSQATLAAHFEETNRRLAAIEEQLVLVSEKVGLPYTTPTAAVPPDVVELARAGKQLAAITRYRDLTGESMDDARNVIVGV